MSLVQCFAEAEGHGRRPHEERPECRDPHYYHGGGRLPSMSAVETLDPREAVLPDD